MALSDYEKQILAEMEQHLRQQDPDLADTMASALPEQEDSDVVPPAKPLSPRRIALGSILGACGLAVILVGVTIGITLWTAILGALGFGMMVGGVLLALSSDPKAPGAGPARGPRPTRPTREDRENQRKDRWQNRGA